MTFSIKIRSTVDNKKLAIRSGMVDENGNITALKKSLIELQREFDANSSY